MATMPLSKVKYSTEKPPMYDICHKHFGADWDKGTIFAYGDTIHAKYPHTVTPDVEAHEEVHFRQQEAIGKDIWWDKYINDDYFRTTQEVEAYKVQIKYALDHYDRNYRKALMKHIYGALAGLSGGVIDIERAKELLS